MINFEAVAKCLSVHPPHPQPNSLLALRVPGIYLGVMLGTASGSHLSSGIAIV